MATYKLPDGTTVSDDMSFTWKTIQYPSNWIKCSTQKDRDAIGLKGPLPEPSWYDQRFYWGPDQPKDHAQLVAEYTAHARRNAGSILSDTDWMVIRKADNGTAIPTDIKSWRESIRTICNEKVAAINATADTDALVAYITGNAYPFWPQLTGDAPANGVQSASYGSQG